MTRMRNLLLVGIGLLIGVVVCELGLRLAGVSYPIFSKIDGDLGVALRPDAEGWWKTEGEAYVRINGDGLRDRDHSRAKPTEVLRIAVLGDSFAEAVQVPSEDAFWSVLERELRGCLALEGREPEVINFGVSGYGTAQELIMLRRRVWAYSPDVVLLAVTPTNDIRNNFKALEKDERRPYFVRDGGQLLEDTSFRDRMAFRLRYSSVGQALTSIRDASRFFQLVNEALRRVSRPVRPGPSVPSQEGRNGVGQADAAQPGDLPAWLRGEVGLDMATYTDPPNQAWQEAWLVTEALVRQMHAEVEARGKLFMVLTVSSGPQVGPDQGARRALEQRLGVSDLFYAEKRLQDLGKYRFPVVPLAPLFQAYAEERKVFLHGFANSGLGQGHWNVAGHRLAGQVVAERLCHALQGPRPNQTAGTTVASGAVHRAP
ncbi:MAG: SGNH/GDSL hydrolase family protein [Nitrospira sp.]|nr:SGNH/GDSL hydrolase family protein [Nitrospira sp.]MEB2337848.1 SGNH/GDSL hydrolase family protein [Nitrospirales bacterium]